MSKAKRAQAGGLRSSSSALSMASLATKPDKGGKPATTIAHTVKVTPRNASAAGMARPVSARSSSSRLMPCGGSASMKAGRASPPASTSSGPTSTWRLRSKSSTSRKSAQPASVELAR